MKRLVSSVFIPSFIVLFAAAPNSSAQPVAKACTNASVNGTYGYTLRGQLVSGNNSVPFADAGTFVADGNGNLTGTDTASQNGQVQTRSGIGTYSINADCTGTALVMETPGSPLHASLVVGADGIQLILTDAGSVVTGTARRRRTACSVQDLNGAYTTAITGWSFDQGGTLRAFSESGQMVSDGAGKLSVKDAVSINGVVTKRSISGSYTLAANCTGTVTLTDPSLGTEHVNFTMVDAGRQMQFVETDPGTTVSGSAERAYNPNGVLSHIASGGPWKTTITVVSQKPIPNEVRVSFWAEDGTPMTLPFTATLQGSSTTGTGSSVDRTINTGGTLVIETEAPNSPLVVGWAEVFSSGPVEGYAVFRAHGPSGDSEGTAPLDKSDALILLLPFDNTSGFATGAAFVNLSASKAATVGVNILDEGGAQLGTETITLPANGHMSFAVGTQFPVTGGKRGTIQLQDNSGGGIAGLGLRFNPAGSFTSIPIVVRE